MMDGHQRGSQAVPLPPPWFPSEITVVLLLLLSAQWQIPFRSITIIPTLIFLAIRDYETAAKHSENDRQIKEGLDRAQRLLKQSKKRDYYKILGVKR